MIETYKIERICSKCGHKQEISVSKKEAAFELVDINKVLGPKCERCSGMTFSIYYESLDLDFELLQEWSTNPDLYLMPQDEELFLAEEKYLNMILQVLDNIQLTDYKSYVLIDALCVIVYDNSIEDNDKRDEQLKNRVIAELNKRKEKLKLANGWIGDYIKDIVYPQLDGEIN